ncbi:MAG TPA: hypothetical protein VJN18_33495 [Polyangiaceae bacterium]|nr:hypothetical protein [Polyangiaceae bacterium]
MDFPASAAPFILRRVSLLGIDSNWRPRSERVQAWQRLAELADPLRSAEVARDITLQQAIPLASELIAGKVRGRLVVDVAADR